MTESQGTAEEQIQELIKKKSLLHMPMIDLDPLSLEYGEVSGLKLALEIVHSENKERVKKLRQIIRQINAPIKGQRAQGQLEDFANELEGESK